MQCDSTAQMRSLVEMTKQQVEVKWELTGPKEIELKKYLKNLNSRGTKGRYLTGKRENKRK